MNETSSAATGKHLSGKCLCGAISFTATANGGEVAACHCRMCRRWSGGVHLALLSATDLAMEVEDNLAVYKSSDWGERCFGKRCRSNLFWRTQSSDHVPIMAGAINEEDRLTFTSQIFIERKPAYFDFANQTTMETEADMIAKYAPQNQSTNSEKQNG